MKIERRVFWGGAAIVAILAGLPLLVVAYQAYRTGVPMSAWFGQLPQPVLAPRTGLENYPSEALPKGEKIDFLVPQPLGQPFTSPPMISFVLPVDLDRDGLMDILVADCTNNCVSWIRQYPLGQFREQVLCENVEAPAHLQVIDFTGDGHLDIVVAVLGMLFPNNDPIGSVVVLENDGKEKFRKHVVLERVPRVADAEAADLNGDGLLDLAVAHFGYDDGQTRWLENLGNWRFRSHILQTLSGPIHCPVADMDDDGLPDIVVIVSQEWEQLWIHKNLGGGQFRPVLVFDCDNEDFGSSGIWLVDLNRDGRLDILYTNGDAFDYIPPRPRPWHGIQWLENRGDLRFEFHRIADIPGAVNAVVFDINGDGYLDIIVASAYNQWENPEAQSLIWLENDGSMRFRPREITNRPTHIQALGAADFDADGRLDLVTGGLHTYPPYDRMERVVLWWNRWK
jgi:hypothetical protein